MKITYDQEIKLCQRMLEKLGMESTRARQFSFAITHSDFTGVYSHGLSRFLNYIKRFRSGAMDPKAEIRLIGEEGSVLRFDCGVSDGLTAVNEVYEHVRDRAKRYGIAMGTGMGAENIGCGNVYGYRASQDGMILLLCCNTVTSVVPYGGMDRIMGTNPIIISAPAGVEAPVILDISTSIAAFGKVLAAAREGTTIPEGWALTREGLPTTDARSAYAIHSFGEYKGYGLAVMVDILSAVLTGACYGRAVGDPIKNERANTGFAMAVIDIEKFMPLDAFQKAMDEYIRSIKDSRPAPGNERIFLPGEMEAEALKKNLNDGLELAPMLMKELVSAAVTLNLIPEGTDFSQLIQMIEKG